MEYFTVTLVYIVFFHANKNDYSKIYFSITSHLEIFPGLGSLMYWWTSCHVMDFQYNISQLSYWCFVARLYHITHKRFCDYIKKENYCKVVPLKVKVWINRIDKNTSYFVLTFSRENSLKTHTLKKFYLNNYLFNQYSLSLYAGYGNIFHQLFRNSTSLSLENLEHPLIFTYRKKTLIKCDISKIWNNKY